MKTKANIKSTRKIGLVYRTQTPAALELAEEVATWLIEREYQVYTAGDQDLVPGTKRANVGKTLNSLALIVVLGGDGTYLEATRILAGRETPILGINMGSLGFLTETKQEEMYVALDRTLNGKMELRPRTMIEACIKRPGRKMVKYTALNDVVIERGSRPQLLNISIYNEKKHVCDAKADGLVICSPTGSTAYNLAGGGPIMHPEVAAFAVCPIAPHSLTNRPIIFPDDRVLTFKVNNETQAGHVLVDGRPASDITEDDELIIRRSKKVHYVVRDPRHDYFSILREKLKFGQRS